MNSNRLAEAMVCFDKAVKLDPKQARAWQLLACVLLSQGKTKQALASIERSITLDFKSPLSHQVKGHCFFQLKKYGEARDSFSRSISMQPDPNEYVARAACHRMLKKYPEQISDLSFVISRKPDNVVALTDRATAYVNTKQYAKAIADCNAVLALPELSEKPNDTNRAVKAHVMKQVGSCLFLQRHYDAALAQFKLVDNGDTTWPANQRAYYWRSMMFFDSGNPDKAIEDLRSGLRFKPDNLTMLRLLGGFLHCEGEDEEAENAINEVLKRSPTRDDYLVRKQYRLSQNNFKGAIADLQKALEMKDESYLWLDLARLQQLSGQKTAARHSFLMGMKSKPKLLGSQRKLQQILKDSAASAKPKHSH